MAMTQIVINRGIGRKSWRRGKEAQIERNGKDTIDSDCYIFSESQLN